jgi:hypothetical protein
MSDAIDGEWKARGWLARYLLGDMPPRMHGLAAADRARDSVETDVDPAGSRVRHSSTPDKRIHG